MMNDSNSQAGIPDYLRGLQNLMMTPKKKKPAPVVPAKLNPLGIGGNGTLAGEVGRYGENYKGQWSGMNRNY